MFCALRVRSSGTAHRTDDAVIGHQLLELLAGLLAAAVGMMQQRIGFTPSPDRHHQGMGDELRCHRSAHGPADNAPREEIDNSSHPTLRCLHNVKSAIHLRLGADAQRIRSNVHCRIGLFIAPRVDSDAGVAVTPGQSQVIITSIPVIAMIPSAVAITRAASAFPLAEPSPARPRPS